MFGKNKTLPTTYGSAGKDSQTEREGAALQVTSIFYTIQGEGPYAGEPAVFIRLSGCNLRCVFCDTEFESGELVSVEVIVSRVTVLAGDVCRLVVLTGGEPMRQQIIPLCAALAKLGYTTQIETAGTVMPPMINNVSVHTLVRSGDVEIVCSPKTVIVHPDIAELCHHYKYIIDAADTYASDGLPTLPTQPSVRGAVPLFRTTDLADTIWVQPRMEYFNNDVNAINAAVTQKNMQRCTELALKYGYRVSLQLHKILGVE